MDPAGAVMIVTGASSGIGAATARLAAAQGAFVVLAARRADRIAALDRYGRVDVLVNNAGQGLHVPVEEVRLEDLQAVVELNVYAPLLAMQAVLPAMRSQGGGVIVNVSSGTSRMVLPGVGAYSATKSALNMLSQVARREWAPDGIVVSLVYPVVTATEFHRSLRAGSIVRREGPAIVPDAPERVAEAILAIVRSGEEEAVLRLHEGRHRPVGG